MTSPTPLPALSSFLPAQHAGHLLVQCLAAQGVQLAFGVPGESYLAALDGFYAEGDKIQFVICRHEGAACFMADALGRLGQQPGVCFVTRGPGATNASIGIHTAFQDSVPLVLFVGDVGAEMRDREAFQELDFASFFGPSTKGMAKRVERIDCAERIPEYVARAFATAMNGRPGPVVLVLPEDMLSEAVSAAAKPLPPVQAVPQSASDAQMAQLHQMLSEAQRPLVIAGGAGWSQTSAQALQQWAQHWQVPVCNAFRYQDCFDNHHPLYAGDVGIGINPKLAQRVRESDLVIALGVRLGEMTTSGYTLLSVPVPQQTLVHVHASPEELNRVYQANLAICAQAGVLAQQLLAYTKSHGADVPASPAWLKWTASASADYAANLLPQALPGNIDMHHVVQVLQQHLPADTVITNGAGNYASWTHRFFKHHGIAKGHKTQLAPTVGSMGYGVPAGIAAAIYANANGKPRTVLTMAGDGDFSMTGQELATAMQYGAKTIIVLLNNESYGTIRMHQEREYPTRVSGTPIVNPDFVQLACAYGYAGERVVKTEEFEPALLAALERNEGTLIELMLDVDVITTRKALSQIRAEALHQP